MNQTAPFRKRGRDIRLVGAAAVGLRALAPPAWIAAQAAAAGAIVGIALGLTGAGGPILAVPLLVSWIGRRLGGPTLARGFAVLIALLAAVLVARNCLGR